MSKMLGKVLVAMVLVLMAMSSSWTRAAARPLLYAEEPSPAGSVRIALPSRPSQWRGRVLLSLEEKKTEPGLPHSPLTLTGPLLPPRPLPTTSSVPDLDRGKRHPDPIASTCIAAPPSPAPASSTLLLDRPLGASASSRHKPSPWLPRLPVLDLFSNQAQTPTRFDVATTFPRRRSASPDLLEPTAFALRPRGEAPGLSLSPRPRRRGRRSPHTHALPLTYRVGRLRPAPLPAAHPCSTLMSPDLRPPLPATPSASPVAAHLRSRSARPGYARPPLPASAVAAGTRLGSLPCRGLVFGRSRLHRPLATPPSSSAAGRRWAGLAGAVPGRPRRGPGRRPTPVPICAARSTPGRAPLAPSARSP
nr:vegetative cell wall protein gp1-like [Aegilops tauschii subsp. strangulata]